MKRFAFRLDSVLAWRTMQLEAEEERLRQVLGLREQAARARDDNEAALLAAGRQVQKGPSVTGAELWALASYREAALERAVELAAQCLERDRELAAQLRKVQDARQRCRLLERLKERRLADWTAENQRELDAFAAEAYLARWRAP